MVLLCHMKYIYFHTRSIHTLIKSDFLLDAWESNGKTISVQKDKLSVFNVV